MDCYEEQRKELREKVLAIREAAIGAEPDCYLAGDLWIQLQVAREEFNMLWAKRRKECQGEMALSLSKDAIISAVVDCLGKIPLYTDVYGYEPCVVQSDCEVSVKLCGGQHDPWGRYPDAYSFQLRSCLPLGAHGDNTEETLRQLWAMQMGVFGPPYVQDGYTIVWNLSRFSTSYVDVSGICCRIMDSWLGCEIAERASSWQCKWCGGPNVWERISCLSCGGPRDWASYGIG